MPAEPLDIFFLPKWRKGSRENWEGCWIIHSHQVGISEKAGQNVMQEGRTITIILLGSTTKTPGSRQP